MKTTIDGAGRVVIPKKVRDEAGLTAGMDLDVVCRDGRVEIEPAQLPYHLEKIDGFLVIVRDESAPALTPELVEETLGQIRDERGLIDEGQD